MWHRLLFLLAIILSASSIKVPVDSIENAPIITVQEPQSTPVYYINNDNSNVDSYLIPPDPYKPDDESSEVNGTPATYLIPPVKEQRTDFYIPEPSAQSDWLPIIQAQTQNFRKSRLQRPPLESIPILFNPNHPKQDGSQFTFPIPSAQLLPPSEDAVNEYFIPIVPEETELRDEKKQQIKVPEYNLPIYDDDKNVQKGTPQLDSIEPTLSRHLLPPKPHQALKPPTKLYPKKYPSEFNPVPIPLAHFAQDEEPLVPKVKPTKYFKTPPSAVLEEFIPSDDKKLFHFNKAENKRKLKDEESVKQHHGDAVTTAATYGGPISTEQETSETNFRYPERNRYASAPLRQAPSPPPSRDAGPAAAPAPNGRTEFRMHGMKGPNSYQFGYDTGKGKNRQFRYEERDNDGLVRGHYGYMDKLGKLRVVNYSAHPEYGFRAEEPVEKE